MSDRFFYIRNGVVLGYRGYDTEITIPAGVTKIGDNAFQNHPLIERATIPEGVTRIGFYAFRACRKLTGIVIPESVKKIDKHAFDDCSVLTSVTYHGVKFNADRTSLTEVFKLIDTKDFSLNEDWKTSLKYSVLWGMFSRNPEDQEVLGAIKKNFVKMFRYLIDENETEIITKVLNESKLINKRNLESIMKYADEKQNEAIQALLKAYQEKNA